MGGFSWFTYKVFKGMARLVHFVASSVLMIHNAPRVQIVRCCGLQSTAGQVWTPSLETIATIAALSWLESTRVQYTHHNKVQHVAFLSHA